MSKESGTAALHLEFTDRVPRTEYSAQYYWKLINRVTGSRVSEESPVTDRVAASNAFMRAWDYAFVWQTLVTGDIFGEKRTRMGHAAYAEGGTDFDSRRGNLFGSPEEAFAFDFDREFAAPDKKTLTENFNRDYHGAVNEFDDAVRMTGIYVTCVSGLIELLGWNTLLEAAGEDPQALGEFINRYCAFMTPYFEALAACDAPVVMLHDDIVWTSGAFMRPEFYRRFVFPNYKKLFAPVIDSGKTVLYTSDGNYTEFVDDIAACGVNGFVMEPMTDMATIAEKYGKTHSFVGNADTRVLLTGTKDDIFREVKRCMDIGKKYPGFIMAVGNHIPPNTPIDSALWYNEFVEKLGRR